MPITSSKHSKQIGRAIGDYIKDQRITRTDLCRLINRSRSCIDKALAGIYSAATLALIEEKLGQTFPAAGSKGYSPQWPGNYTRSSMRPYVGEYLCAQMDLKGRTNIIAYSVKIDWNEAAGVLTFREADRPDAQYIQQGQVWIPRSTNYVYFVTISGEGNVRVALVSPIDRTERMRGLLLTLHQVQGAAYLPAVTPIVYVKRKNLEKGEFGRISHGHPKFAELSQALLDVARYVRLPLPEGWEDHKK